MALQARQAGTAAGSQIASRNQQALQFDATLAEQASASTAKLNRGAAEDAINRAYRTQRDSAKDLASADERSLRRDNATALKDYRNASLDVKDAQAELAQTRFLTQLQDKADKSAAEAALNKKLAEAISGGHSVVDIVKDDPSLMNNELAKQLVRNELISGRAKGSKYSGLMQALGLDNNAAPAGGSTNAPAFKIRSVR